jgi:hypothetical protein
MKSTTTWSVIGGAAICLAIAACSGPTSEPTASSSEDPREALIASVSDRFAANGLTEVQVLCLEGYLSTFETSWLEYLSENYDAPLEDGPAGMPARLATAISDCLTS